MMMAAVMLVSCGAPRKAAKKPVKTYVQPGADMLNAPDVLRAWAMGTSDSEMTAKKKAMASANAQLAGMLNTVVNTTIDDYCVVLSAGDVGESREYLSQKTNIVSKQVLIGARPVFEEWEAKDAEGMYRCYVVLEISGEEYVKKLLEAMNSVQGQSAKHIDQDLLHELFMKTINSGK